MCCDALEAKAVTAVGHEGVSEQAHAYRTRKVVLCETEQGRCATLGHGGRTSAALVLVLSTHHHVASQHSAES